MKNLIIISILTIIFNHIIFGQNNFANESNYYIKDNFKGIPEIDSNLNTSANSNKHFDTVINNAFETLWLSWIIANSQECFLIQNSFIIPFEDDYDVEPANYSRNYFSSPSYWYDTRTKPFNISFIMLDTLPSFAIIDNIRILLLWENDKIIKCEALGNKIFDFNIEYNSLNQPYKFIGRRHTLDTNIEEIIVEYVDSTLSKLTSYKINDNLIRRKNNSISFQYHDNNCVTIIHKTYKTKFFNTSCSMTIGKANDSTYYINTANELNSYYYNYRNQLKRIESTINKEKQTVEMIYVSDILWQEKKQYYKKDKLFSTKYINHFSNYSNSFLENNYQWKIGYYIFNKKNILIEEGGDLWHRKRRNGSSNWKEYSIL